MKGVRLARVTTEELEKAPEFRYLASWVRREAQAVFQEVRDVPAGEPLALGGSGPVLVLDGSTLLTRRSLETMHRVTVEQCSTAVASPLAETAVSQDRPLYTLRDYEAVEERFLASGETTRPTGRPVAALLLPQRATEGALRDTPPESWLELPEELLADCGATGAGLCHRFTDYYGQAREDLVSLLRRRGLFRRDGAVPRLVEVGCGRGATARLLQEHLGCRVTGVELNPIAARAAAAHLHRVVAGDIHQVAPQLASHGPFDGLVALELFEHLTDQEGFLELARRLVKPGGWLILSVPNVGHYAVVEDLLAGRWDYLPIGILCYTHYRFFTRQTLEDWLSRCGFSTVRLLPQETELPEPWREPPSGLEVDRDSLRTKGFYVLARVE